MRQGPAEFGEAQCQQVHGRHLGDEGLGRGNADLEAGPGVEHGIGVAGRLAAHDVGHGEDGRPGFLGQAHGGQRVGGLTRLGDADDQGAGSDDRIRVPELGGDVHADRHPGPLADRVPADQAGVVGGAAGDDHDPLDALQVLVAQSDIGQVDPVVVRHAVEDRLGDRFGLLVDLLHHEGVVAALFGLLFVPLDQSRTRVRPDRRRPW